MYFDPGTGSAIIQLLVALAAIGGSLWFAFRRKISAFLKKTKKAGEGTDIEKTGTKPAGGVDDVIDPLSADKQFFDVEERG